MKQPDAIFRHYLIEALDLKLRLEIMKDPGRRESFERAANRLKTTLLAPETHGQGADVHEGKTKRTRRTGPE